MAVGDPVTAAVNRAGRSAFFSVQKRDIIVAVTPVQLEIEAVRKLDFIGGTLHRVELETAKRQSTARIRRAGVVEPETLVQQISRRARNASF